MLNKASAIKKFYRERRYLTPINPFLHVKITKSYSPGGSANALLEKLFENYFERHSDVAHLRPVVSELSRDIDSALQNYSENTAPCNAVRKSKKIPPDRESGDGSSSDSISRTLNLRRLLYRKLENLLRTYCLSARTMESMSFVRPTEYFDIVTELYAKYSDDTVWVHYIGVQSLAQLTEFLWEHKNVVGKSLFQKCIVATPVFKETSYFSFLLARTLVPMNLKQFQEDLQLRADALQGLLHVVLVKMKISLKYAPKTINREIIELFLENAIRGKGDSGIFMYTPMKMHVELTSWINETDYSSSLEELMRATHAGETFVSFYSRMLKVRFLDHLFFPFWYTHDL